MPKRRNLNGIPHNVMKSFFSTLRYHDGGYMGDWLFNTARKHQLKDASLEVLTATFNPRALNIKPLLFHAKLLPEIVEKELLANGFPIDFLRSVIINFKFPDAVLYETTFYCFPVMIDVDGHRYEFKRIIESSYIRF